MLIPWRVMPHWIFPQFPSLIDLPDGEPEPEETHELSPTRVPLFYGFRQRKKKNGGGNLRPNKKTPFGD